MLCNILLDELPKITPNNYKINTSYKQGIKFELLMQDNELQKEEKVMLALALFYDKKEINKIETPEELQKRINDILWFGGSELRIYYLNLANQCYIKLCICYLFLLYR